MLLFYVLVIGLNPTYCYRGSQLLTPADIRPLHLRKIMYASTELKTIFNLNIHNKTYICKHILKHIYLTPVKTQLLQYNLTLDLMLYYHSYQIKNMNILSRYQGNVLLVLIKQCR